MRECIRRAWLPLLALCLVAASPARSADTDAAYKAALPLYQYDKNLPLAVKTGVIETFPDGRMMRFSYASTHDQRVPALLFVPKSASAVHPVPCLVLLHGLGKNKESMIDTAHYAATLGYASLAIDEYGQGERATTPAGQTVSADFVQQQIMTGVPQTVVDVRRGLDYLETRPNIDRKRLGLLGGSLGAIMGTVAAGVDDRIKAAALLSGGGDWAVILKYLAEHAAKLSGHSVTGTANVDWTMVSAFLSAEDPLTFAPHIAPRPVLMVNGRQDTTIVPQAAEELYRAVQSGPDAHVQMNWLDAGHVPPAEQVLPIVRTWLTKNL